MTRDEWNALGCDCIVRFDQRDDNYWTDMCPTHATAPDLVAALRAFVAWYPNHTDDSFPALVKVRAALAKAEGGAK